MRLLLYDSRYSDLENKLAKGNAAFHSSQLTLRGDVPNAGEGSEKPRISSELLSSKVDGNTSHSLEGHLATFMWGFWRCQDEVTFLLPELDVPLFSEDALVVSPQRWCVVKLCGRAIDFDETGIVSAMSCLESIPALNISTATTNCTLVPEEKLELALQMLSRTLNCQVHR